MKTTPHRVVLVVLDGWGLAPKGPGNAIALAKKPNLDRMIQEYPNTSLLAAGEAVGLKEGESGNSEAGHLNLGAGRLVWQEKIIVTRSIQNGSFFQNETLLGAIAHARRNRSALHLVGLLSDGQSGHSEPEHLEALLVLCKQQRAKRVNLHLFTDGRDSGPKTALELLRRLEALMRNLEVGQVATVGGRYYGMDRSGNWERIGLMYEAMAHGEGARAASASDAILKSYRRGVTDEFIRPTVIGGGRRVAAGDAVVFFNLRSDRARQLCKTFVAPQECVSDVYDCRGFRPLRRLFFVTLSDFGSDLPGVRVAFVPEELPNTLPHYLGKHDALRQLFVAEREKFAHVTYFFHGGRARAERNESRIRVESLRVATFDRTPAMSAEEITDAVAASMAKNVYSLIVCNYANADMLGHTGSLRQTVRAVEIVDAQMGRLAAAAAETSAEVVITADHGNAERMLDSRTGKIDTGHTANPVPLIVVSRARRRQGLRKSHLSGASLRDVSPTVLQLLELPVPAEMTGASLFS